MRRTYKAQFLDRLDVWLHECISVDEGSMNCACDLYVFYIYRLIKDF